MTRDNWHVERVMTKHTQGEWWVDEFNRVRSCDSDAFIAHMSDGDFPDHREFDGNTQAANARLIAAAPKMLEALENAICGHCIKDDVWEKISAAISKAKGE
tara:strand:+ start:117 stop:419 length:303 start_codon:yes stop_codon:yes gene_type:complete